MSWRHAAALRPLLVVSVVGALFTVDELASRRRGATASVDPGPPPLPAPAAKAPCPTDTLPDHGVCVPVPKPEPISPAPAEARLDLLPGRPEDYARYLTPISAHSGSAAPPGAASTSGSALTVYASAGTDARAIRLDSQLGATRWAASPGGEKVLLTLHRVQRGGSVRSYLLMYRGLEFQAPAAWTEIADGSIIGRLTPELKPPGLRLSVRQLRRGVQPEKAPSERLLRDSHSLDCDPRNVLPLAP